MCFSSSWKRPSYFYGSYINVHGLGLAEEVVHWPRTVAAASSHCELISDVQFCSFLNIYKSACSMQHSAVMPLSRC